MSARPQARPFLYERNTLDWAKAADLLQAWLESMLRSKGQQSSNHFEWDAFYLTPNEVTTVCAAASKAADENLSAYRKSLLQIQM